MTKAQLAAALAEGFEKTLAGVGDSKVMPLAQAMQSYVKPGLVLYLGRMANAATSEIVRQFRGTSPDFTVVGGSRNFTWAMVHTGLVKRLAGSAFGELYPSPGPSYPIQKAARDGRVVIENWSELTLIQRLMAGAMGIGFAATRVDAGPGLAENAGLIAALHDPFTADNKVTALKALTPDVAVVHGWMADDLGNVIMGQPNLSDQDVWGALASKQVVATVEKVVSRDFIRRHSCLVSLSAIRVDAVCEVPFGAHPQAMSALGLGDINGLESYEMDEEFIESYRRIGREPEALDGWLEEWVYGCRSYSEYLNKLQSRGKPVPWRPDDKQWRDQLASTMAQEYTWSSRASTKEWMSVAAARHIERAVRQSNYQLILAGVGQGGLAAWLAHYRLVQACYPARMVVGLGILGYAPRPGSPHTSSLANIATAEAVVDTYKGYGVYVGGRYGRCISVLGAGQIDSFGNINSTKTANGGYLFGSGGAIDAANAAEILVVAPQTRERLTNQLAYVTCWGRKVRKLVTDRAVFEKQGSDGDARFVLTAWLPINGASSEREAVAAIRDTCGWDFAVAPHLVKEAPPTIEELAVIRVFDPGGLFLKQE